MKTEWNRAQMFQICPRMRYINFHKDGTGVERRELSLNQFVSRRVRFYMGSILGMLHPEDASNLVHADIMAMGRAQGFDGCDFAEVSEVAARAQKIVSAFSRDNLSNYEILEANRTRSFPLADGVEFVSTSVALLKDREHTVIYFPYVVTDWDARRHARMHRNFQALSELATYRYNDVDVDGVVVQPVITKRGNTWREPFFFPYDDDLVENWVAQVAAQEHDIPRKVLMKDIDKTFPQHRHSCDYGCPYRDVCWGELDVHHPLLKDDPRYQLRVLEPWEMA